jgi:hypothetical protein
MTVNSAGQPCIYHPCDNENLLPELNVLMIEVILLFSQNVQALNHNKALFNQSIFDQLMLLWQNSD